MNTNMADGAAQRLVAQMGEALFGQPGLTLMELAEKVKGMQLGTAHAAYHTGKAIGRREAELSAQPSPAGQAEALAVIQSYENAGARFRDSLHDDHCSDARRVELLKDRDASREALVSALAARQPVVENPAWRDELVREAYNRGLADGLNADRQPVGQEPVGRVGDFVHWYGGRPALGTELYAAPPAQPVDTWAVIERVAKNWDGCSIGPAIRAEAEKLIGQPAQAVDADILDELNATIEQRDALSLEVLRLNAHAVDLGQLPRYEPIGSDGMNMERVADGRWMKRDDVLALTDSKAVGNV